MRLNPHFALMPHRTALSFGLPAAYFGNLGSADALVRLLQGHGAGVVPPVSALAAYTFLPQDALNVGAYVLVPIDGRRPEPRTGRWTPPARWFSRCVGVVDGKLAYRYERGEVPAPGGQLCWLPTIPGPWESMGSRLRMYGCSSNPWMLVHYPGGHPEVPAYAHPDYQWENSL